MLYALRHYSVPLLLAALIHVAAVGALFVGWNPVKQETREFKPRIVQSQLLVLQPEARQKPKPPPVVKPPPPVAAEPPPPKPEPTPSPDRPPSTGVKRSGSGNSSSSVSAFRNSPGSRSPRRWKPRQTNSPRETTSRSPQATGSASTSVSSPTGPGR